MTNDEIANDWNADSLSGKTKASTNLAAMDIGELAELLKCGAITKAAHDMAVSVIERTAGHMTAEASEVMDSMRTYREPAADAESSLELIDDEPGLLQPADAVISAQPGSNNFADRILSIAKRRAGDVLVNPDNPKLRNDDKRSRLTTTLGKFGKVGVLFSYFGDDGKEYYFDGNTRGDLDPDEEWQIATTNLTQTEVDELVFVYDHLAGLIDWDPEITNRLIDNLTEQDADDNLAAMIKNIAADVIIETEPDASQLAAEPKVDAGAALAIKWKTKPGQVWEITSERATHRIACGDCTNEKLIAKLFGDVAKVDLIGTDPPYCSGGFDESSKSAGSVGTDRVDVVDIVNDRLSSRGYQALLKQSLNMVRSDYLLAFTDWRMWTYLFDLVESSAFRVKSMIVWDKISPGMGQGWRTQHELIMWGCRVAPPFKLEPGKGSISNVIQCKRSGNNLHTTEKPTELFGKLLANLKDFVGSVYDPFAGSGTMIVAADFHGMDSFACELSRNYVAVALERMADAGCECELISK